MTQDAPVNRPRRSRMQFGLRSLLVAVASLSIALAWFMGKVQDERTRREILGIGERHRELARSKGEIGWVPKSFDVDEWAAWVDGHRPAATSFQATIDRNASAKSLDQLARLFPKAGGARIPIERLSPSVAAQLVAMTNCRSIAVGGSGRQAIDAPTLAALRPALVRCEFQRVLVDDKLLIALADADWQGRYLPCSRWEIGPAGVAALARLPELRMAVLDGPELTDESLAALESHPNLWTVVLFAPRVTDAGVTRLGKIPHLDRLMINASEQGAVGVTEAGCESLRIATNRRVTVRRSEDGQWYGVPPLRASR